MCPKKNNILKGTKWDFYLFSPKWDYLFILGQKFNITSYHFRQIDRCHIIFKYEMSIIKVKIWDTFTKTHGWDIKNELNSITIKYKILNSYILNYLIIIILIKVMELLHMCNDYVWREELKWRDEGVNRVNIMMKIVWLFLFQPKTKVGLK